MFSIRQRARSQHSRAAPVLQVLTSDTTATGAALLCWLRARWRIENMFKYASAHNGIDTLADYLTDIGPDTRTVTNPARVAARKTVAEAQAALATAERALPQLLAGPGTPAQLHAAPPALQRLPDRPQRVPGHPAQPAPPRRAGRLHHQRNHRHPRPARQPASGTRPRAAGRGTQRHPSMPARGPPPADLPGHCGMSLNTDLVST